MLRSGEHRKPWYVKLNRRAVVPTLIDGDRVITESNDWYARCQARPSFAEAIRKWENPDYLGLMQRRGREGMAEGAGDHPSGLRGRA